MFASPFYIERIIISGHQRFAYCDIDLTHPTTGEPLKECCFIGPNGAGKSALLEILHASVSPIGGFSEANPDALILTKTRTTKGSFFRLHCDLAECEDGVICFEAALEADKSWGRLAAEPLSADEFVDVFQQYRCYHEAESEAIQPGGVEVYVAFFSLFDTLLNSNPADDFAAFLAGVVHEKESRFYKFLKQADNRSKTVEELEADFLRSYPNVLSAIKEIWEKIIRSSGLSFQAEGKGRFISVSTGNEVGFSSLDRGLQHLIIKTGHLFCHYFQKENQAGFLFLEEPETSLHPELQCNLINLYRSIINAHPSQLFASTHSPLIASQFSGYSRILLNRDRKGTIYISRGTAPDGCDPNRILMKDFGLKTVQPQKHRESGENYTKLKRAIQASDEQENELADLIDQAVTIRRI